MTNRRLSQHLACHSSFNRIYDALGIIGASLYVNLPRTRTKFREGPTGLVCDKLKHNSNRNFYKRDTRLIMAAGYS